MPGQAPEVFLKLTAHGTGLLWIPLPQQDAAAGSQGMPRQARAVFLKLGPNGTRSSRFNGTCVC